LWIESDKRGIDIPFRGHGIFSHSFFSFWRRGLPFGGVRLTDSLAVTGEDPLFKFGERGYWGPPTGFSNICWGDPPFRSPRFFFCGRTGSPKEDPSGARRGETHLLNGHTTPHHISLRGALSAGGHVRTKHPSRFAQPGIQYLASWPNESNHNATYCAPPQQLG